MEEDFKSRGEVCPQLLDLISKEIVRKPGDPTHGKDLKATEDNDLEMRLGIPGEQRGGRRREDKEEVDSSVLSLGFKASKPTTTTTTTNLSLGAQRGFFDTVEHEREGGGLVQLQSRGGLGKELSQKGSGTNEKAEQQQNHERKAPHACAAGTSTRSQTRNIPVPVAGWPPIRSFRKNLASNSLKPSVESANAQLETREMKPENCKKGLFVKINMDGIPIGRKVDLKAYKNYKKLSEAVQGLFKDLLAAQKDPFSCDDAQKNEVDELFSGLLDGTGKYILVYEDSEGDSMLVGDVPLDRELQEEDINCIKLNWQTTFIHISIVLSCFSICRSLRIGSQWKFVDTCIR